MIKPLHDYVLLEKVKEEEKTESGIILTTKEAKDEPSHGIVVARWKMESWLRLKSMLVTASSIRSIPEQKSRKTRRIIF